MCKRREMAKQNKTVRMQEYEGQECIALRPLWEEVFWEDSEEFTEYYFKEKAGCNHAFALKDGESAVAMVHLTPYEMELRVGVDFVREKVSYIVGVATKKEFRHRGYMDVLLKKSLYDMYQEKQPFTFLMPADPAIYRPYQFAYIYDRESFEWKDMAALESEWSISVFQESETEELLNYVNQTLRKRQDVFIKRDRNYYRTMVKELHAQNGGLYLVRKKAADVYGDRFRTEKKNGRKRNEINGFFLYTEEAGIPEIQEAVWSDERPLFQVKKERKPIIMARIVCLYRLLSLLRTKDGEEETTISFAMEDPLLAENNGVWSCRLSRTQAAVVHENAGSRVQDREGCRTECFVTADGLISFLFGCREAEECFTFPEGADAENVLCKLNSIQLFRRVFINEIV